MGGERGRRGFVQREEQYVLYEFRRKGTEEDGGYSGEEEGEVAECAIYWTKRRSER